MVSVCDVIYSKLVFCFVVVVLFLLFFVCFFFPSVFYLWLYRLAQVYIYLVTGQCYRGMSIKLLIKETGQSFVVLWMLLEVLHQTHLTAVIFVNWECFVLDFVHHFFFSLSLWLCMYEAFLCTEGSVCVCVCSPLLFIIWIVNLIVTVIICITCNKLFKLMILIAQHCLWVYFSVIFDFT